MIIPSCERIEELSGDYDNIPLCKEILADVMTPISLLKKLSAISQRLFLLESVEGGENWGRYSFLGFDPIMRVRAKDGKVAIEHDDSETVYSDKNPYDVLRGILSQ